MTKKLISLALMLVLLLGAFAFAEAELQTIELGTSGITMQIAASYAEGEITAEDTDESQVAYYASEECLVDFDIYQWAKAEGETLEAAAAEEAAEYGAETVATELNGVPAFYYEATEESEGVEYTTTTFMMENGDFFAEIVFWMDGEDAGDWVEGMVNTIAIAETADVTDAGNEIVLGTSTLKITTPVAFVKGEITTEDTDESQVAYYASEETTVDFDVYQWAKADGETLEGVAAEEAAEYGAEIQNVTCGDIAMAMYEAIEEDEGAEYVTRTYIMEDGNDFVEIVFWVDGEDAPATVDAIINSITRG